MEPLVELMRRYVVDYLNRQDLGICREIMDPDYTLHIGGHQLSGRDGAYVPAMERQFHQFPRLGMTVHEVVVSGDRIALRFSEHGASTRHEGRRAAWGGVALYHWDGARLTVTFAEEDYASRIAQLSDGRCLPVEPPCPAPWDSSSEPGSPDNERLVKAWLLKGDWTCGRVFLDGSLVPGQGEGLLDVSEVEIDDLFSAGARVAFHALLRGEYTGGLDAPAERVGSQSSVHVAGVVGVDGDGTIIGHLVRDRVGLQRRLRDGVNSTVDKRSAPP